jgi:hypothetical protein
MRKIELRMLQLIANKQSGNCSGNTTVFCHSQNNWCSVHLHGHHIATVSQNGIVKPDLDTLKKYPTMTTKSRLRALGVNVSTRKRVVFVDDNAI